MSEQPPGGTPPRDENDPSPSVPPPPPPGASGPVPPPPGQGTPPPAPGYGAPPPAPGYGTPPPPGQGTPPPAPGYGGAYPPPGQQYGGSGGPQVAGVSEAFTYGWNKFTANLGPIILAVLAYLGIGILLSIVWYLVLGAIGLGMGSTGNDSLATAGLFGVLVATGLFSLVAMLIVYVMQAGVIRGALQLTYGRPLDVKTFFQFDSLGNVLLASLLVSVLTAVGYMLCYVPGLVVGFFAQFTLFFVVDKRMGAIDALKASFDLVNKNLGTVVVLFLGVLVANAIGSALCGIGLLVTIPVSILAQAYMYRRLQGEPVAP